MKKADEDELAKLVKLTKLMKQENVKVAPKGPPRGANKWRQQDPKFSPPEPKAANPNLVEAGGMQVDPSLKDAYEQWRQDKIIEQNERREMAHPGLHAAFRLERDQDRPAREAAQEVARAVNGVYNPSPSRRRLFAAALLPQQSILGERFGQKARNQPLGLAVGYGHRRQVRLGLGRNPMGLVLKCQFSRPQGSGTGNLDFPFVAHTVLTLHATGNGTLVGCG